MNMTIFNLKVNKCVNVDSFIYLGHTTRYYTGTSEANYV